MPPNADILIATVPGALELPLALQTMAESGDYDALIALGAVLLGVLIVILLWRIRGWDPRWLKRWRSWQMSCACFSNTSACSSANNAHSAFNTLML